MKTVAVLDETNRALVRQDQATLSLADRTWNGRLRRPLLPAVVLSLLWGLLTGWRGESWVFGAPAVLLGLYILTLLPQGQGWRLAPVAVVRFAGWFAVQAVLGAVDVARRALSPRMPLNPGFRSWRTGLPEGTPRVVLANAVTLLPGTLSAEVEGQRLVVHLLDCRADLSAEIGQLETRIAAIFASSVGKERAA